jgi:hypothetical protein
MTGITTERGASATDIQDYFASQREFRFAEHPMRSRDTVRWAIEKSELKPE